MSFPPQIHPHPCRAGHRETQGRDRAPPTCIPSPPRSQCLVEGVGGHVLETSQAQNTRKKGRREPSGIPWVEGRIQANELQTVVHGWRTHTHKHAQRHHHHHHVRRTRKERIRKEKKRADDARKPRQRNHPRGKDVQPAGQGPPRERNEDVRQGKDPKTERLVPPFPSGTEREKETPIQDKRKGTRTKKRRDRASETQATLKTTPTIGRPTTKALQTRDREKTVS